MREILFRGRFTTDVDKGLKEWAFGDLVQPLHKRWTQIKGKAPSLGSARTTVTVEYETVGQYTGMKDNAGVKIFEGDIVKLPEFTIEDEHFPESQAEVFWDDGGWALREYGCMEDLIILDHECAADITVIGNIWDSPELLEGGQENGN